MKKLLLVIDVKKDFINEHTKKILPILIYLSKIMRYMF